MENVVSPRCNQVSRKRFFLHKAIKIDHQIANFDNVCTNCTMHVRKYFESSH